MLAGALNERAWVLATSPDPKLRDGAKAKADATRANELTGWKYGPHLDTLAAACAELGDFEAAMQWAQKAIELVSEAEKPAIRERLDLYRAKKPFRK
jgi:serine/threonine-protein kinase